ncbi:MAG: hypothetical protein ABS46_04610 [Cytophagaceae bacterium SCN 52-12]|nr:MAG: hypothetical protein ABS46_04610 [Cytophagaceae bacterium SCN 52-12]
MTVSARIKRSHHGRNLKRFREMLGIKQEALAFELGDTWSQKRVSLLEQKETIPREVVEHIAEALQVPAKAILDFDEETAIQNLRNHYENIPSFSEETVSPAPIPQPEQETRVPAQHLPVLPASFNPLEKWVAALEENEKLYERLLKSEQEKVQMLQKLLDLR